MSPSTTSSRSPAAAASGRLSRAPVEKLSRTRTRAPSLRSRSVRWDPMKPAPPVTRTVPFTRRLYHSAAPRPRLRDGSALAGRFFRFRPRHPMPACVAVRHREPGESLSVAAPDGPGSALFCKVPCAMYSRLNDSRHHGILRREFVTVAEEDVMRLRRLGLLGLVGLVMVAPAASAQTKEDTIVYALQSDIPNWDPPNSVLRESIILGYNVFDHLAARDLKTGKVGPSLALSWKTIDDATWEVKLRPGVKFHDGTSFTAKDVKATFERVLDEKNKLTARGNHAKIKSVEVMDDLTVRFRTDGPYPLFVERLTALVIQSDKAIREKGHEWMQENPVGTGPYKLV